MAMALDNAPPGVPTSSEAHGDRDTPESKAAKLPLSAVAHNFSTKKELMGVRTRVRLYEVLDGLCGVDDGPWTFFKKALWNLVQVKLVAIAIAVTVIPLIWFHQSMHVTYLEELSTFTNATTTERHALLGFNGMFEPSRPLFWMWTATFTVFGTLNFLCVSVVWIYVISGYQPLTRGMVLVTVGTFVAFAGYIFGGYLLTALGGLEIPQLLFNAPAFLSAAVISWLCGIAARHTVGLPSLPKVLCFQVLINAVVFYVYTEWIPTWFLATESDFLRLLIRVIIHPILVECIVGTMRVASLFYPTELDQSTLVVFMFPAYIVSNLLGRFLVATSSTFGWALATTICLSVQEVAMRMTVWRRDYFYLRLFYTVEKAESMAYSKRARRLKADILTLDAITEDLGILVSPAIIYFYQLASTNSEVGSFISIGPLLTTMLMQFLIETLTDFGPSLFVIIVDNPQYLSAAWNFRQAVAKKKKAKQAKQLLNQEAKADAPDESAVGPDGTPSSRKQFLLAMRGKGSGPTHGITSIEAEAPSPMSASRQTSFFKQRTVSRGNRSRWQRTLATFRMIKGIHESPFVDPDEEEAHANKSLEQIELAEMESRLSMCTTKGEVAREMAYQRNKLAWVSVGRDKTNGTLRIHRAASDKQISNMNPTVAERVFNWLQLAEPITYVTRIKRGHVNTINAWHSTFPGYGIVFWLYYVIWAEYFLRFFFFPTVVICAVNRDDGQWPEWQFRSCSFT